MDSDLNLLIMYISDEQLRRVAVKIKNGLNTELRENYKYFKEPEIFETLKNLLPSHISNSVEYIVGVKEITDIVLLEDKGE